VQCTHVCRVPAGSMSVEPSGRYPIAEEAAAGAAVERAEAIAASWPLLSMQFVAALSPTT